MDDLHYNVDSVLTHNCLFNFLVGSRGIGKTYSAKYRAIKNWLKNGSEFVYLRRYDTELKKDKLDKLFNDIAIEFPENELTVKGKEFYIDKYPLGYAMALSQASQYKSVPFPKVSLIIFDEFIIDKGSLRYLPNEVETFLEMYSTIARDRDVTVLFLSNAITFTNPYFLYFDLKLEEGKSLIKKSTIPGERKDILLEVIPSTKYAEHMSKTRLGKIVAGTRWGDYSIDNKFLRDDNTFIEEMSTACYCMYNLKTNSGTYGVYNDFINGLLFISEKYDPTSKYNIAVNTDALGDKTIGKTSMGKTFINTLKEKFMNGEVRFTSQKAKNICMNIVKFNL